MNNKIQRLISKSMLVIYVLSLLLSVMPVQIYAAGPKSSTKSSSKSSYKSSSSRYKSSGSSYKSSSSSKSSSSKSYSSSSKASSSSSKSNSSKSSGGFLGKVASSVKSAVSKAATKVTSTAKKAVSSTASKVSSTYKAVTKKVSSTASKITNTVKAAGSNAAKAVAKAAAPIKKAVAKVAAPVKQAVSNTAKKITTTINSVKQKAASAVNSAAKNIKNIAANIGKTAKTVAANAGKKIGAAVQQVKTAVSNAKTNVAKLVKETKTLVSNAQEKIKTTIKGYATLMKEKVKTGVSNAVSKVKQTAANVWNKTKQTVSNIAKNPVVQRVTKGVGATLQIAGGIVQTAGGIALSGTGLGAIIGVPVTAHGAADIVQGGLKLFNAITGKSVPEVNFMQEAFKFVGRTVGGAKGEAIASRIFTVADIGLGLISPAKLMGTFSKINNLGDLAKYVKAAPKNIIKNSIDMIPKVFKSVKTAGARAVGNISNIGNKLRVAATKTYTAVKGIPAKAANILSDAKKFTAGFKTTAAKAAKAVKSEFDIIKQAIEQGSKAYQKTAGKTVAISSNGAGELQKLYDKAASIVKEYKGIKGADKLDDVIRGGVNGATYEGKLYRSVGPDLNGMPGDPLDIHAGNIASNHRYTQPGTGGLYFSTGEKIVNAELNTWKVATEGRVMHTFDVKIDNLLDVSNPSVRKQLGVTLDDIVGNSYDITHKIGEYAKTKGYSGIVAPSARADGGLNVILFSGKSIK